MIRFLAACLLALSCASTCRAAEKTLAEMLADGSFLTLPPSPVDIQFEADTEAQAQADIGPAGGSMSITGSDGTAYEFVVPSGALLSEATITMSVLTKLEGMPKESGNAYAVLFGPEGLSFETAATLTISPITEAKTGSIALAFAAKGDGKDVRLAQMRGDGPATRIAVWHFSTVGVSQPTSPKAREAIADSRQRDIESLIENKIATLFPNIDFTEPGIAVPDFTPGTPAGDYFSLVRMLFETVLPGRLDKAARPGAGCAEVADLTSLITTGLLAIKSMPESHPLRQLLKPLYGQALRSVATSGGFMSAIRKCVEKLAADCAFAGTAGIDLQQYVNDLLVLQAVAQGREMKASERKKAVADKMAELTRHCHPFQVEFSSDWLLDNDCWLMKAGVRADFVTTFDERRSAIRGSGTQVITDWTFHAQPACAEVMGTGVNPRSTRPMVATVDSITMSREDYSIEEVQITLDLGAVTHTQSNIVSTVDLSIWQLPFTSGCFGQPIQIIAKPTGDADGSLVSQVTQVGKGCKGWQMVNTMEIRWTTKLTPIPRN